MRLDPRRRYSYVDGGALEAALEDHRTLDGLMKVLGVPGKPAHLRKLSAPEKRAAVEQQVDHLRAMETSLWYQVDVPHVVAGSLWSTWRNSRDARDIFADAPKEARLLAPVAQWLRTQHGLAVYAEIAMGTKCCDVVGYQNAGWLRPERVVGVELKNEASQLKRGLDQMTTFKEYANEVYLAVTTRFALDYLQAHAESRSVWHWDPEVLNNKLRHFGIGLLVVDWPNGAARVEEVLAPASSSLAEGKRREVLARIRDRVPLV